MDHALETGLRLRLRRALRRMESQHQHLRPLLAELDTAVQAGAFEEVPERLTRLRVALAAHFEIEESVLFPALHGLSPRSQGALETLSREHGAFLSQLLDLSTAANARGAQAVSQLRKALAEHEQREERLLEGFVRAENGSGA